VSTPDVPIVAIAVELLTQVPPEGEPVSESVEPAQTNPPPEIDDVEVTVTSAVL
jgi:hypothetical protein